MRTLVESFLEWALAHPGKARFMYQAMALELSGPQHRDLLKATARLQEPIFA